MFFRLFVGTWTGGSKALGRPSDRPAVPGREEPGGPVRGGQPAAAQQGEGPHPPLCRLAALQHHGRHAKRNLRAVREDRLHSADHGPGDWEVQGLRIHHGKLS